MSSASCRCNSPLFLDGEDLTVPPVSKSTTSKAPLYVGRRGALEPVSTVVLRGGPDGGRQHSVDEERSNSMPLWLLVASLPVVAVWNDIDMLCALPLFGWRWAVCWLREGEEFNVDDELSASEREQNVHYERPIETKKLNLEIKMEIKDRIIRFARSRRRNRIDRS